LRRFPPTSGKRQIKLCNGLLRNLYKGEEKEAAVAVDQALWALGGATREAIEGAHAELGKGRR
jgi:hypothetical protein